MNTLESGRVKSVNLVNNTAQVFLRTGLKSATVPFNPATEKPSVGEAVLVGKASNSWKILQAKGRLPKKGNVFGMVGLTNFNYYVLYVVDGVTKARRYDSNKNFIGEVVWTGVIPSCYEWGTTNSFDIFMAKETFAGYTDNHFDLYRESTGAFTHNFISSVVGQPWLVVHVLENTILIARTRAGIPEVKYYRIGADGSRITLAEYDSLVVVYHEGDYIYTTWGKIGEDGYSYDVARILSDRMTGEYTETEGWSYGDYSLPSGGTGTFEWSNRSWMSGQVYRQFDITTVGYNGNVVSKEQTTAYCLPFRVLEFVKRLVAEYPYIGTKTTEIGSVASVSFISTGFGTTFYWVTELYVNVEYNPYKLNETYYNHTLYDTNGTVIWSMANCPYNFTPMIRKLTAEWKNVRGSKNLIYVTFAISDAYGYGDVDYILVDGVKKTKSQFCALFGIPTGATFSGIYGVTKEFF